MSLCRKTRGFTLVELLVVIGIIALLISILLPSLQKARTQANRLVCMSNERQMLNALMMYATDNNGILPSDTDPGGNKGWIDNDCTPWNPYAVERNPWWSVDSSGNPLPGTDHPAPSFLAKYLGFSTAVKPDVNASYPSPRCVHCPDDLDQEVVSAQGDQNGNWYGPIYIGYQGTGARTSYWYPRSLFCSPDAIRRAAGAKGNGLATVSSVKITQARHSSKKIAIIELHAYHEKVEAFPQYAIINYGKYPDYVAGFCDYHAENVNVKDMLDTDVNWTGRATGGVPGWGIEGQDVR